MKKAKPETKPPEGNGLSPPDKVRTKPAEEYLDNGRHLCHLLTHMAEGYAYCRMMFEDGKAMDWVYLAVNEAFARLTGLGNVIGKRVSELIPGISESDPELFEIYSSVALTGRPERFERYIQALDKWFSVSVYSPAMEHFVAIFDVVTERKRNELEIERLNRDLRQRVSELEAIFDTSPIGLSVAEDNQGLHIRGNRTLEGLLGLKSDGELSLRAQPGGFRAFCGGEAMPVDELPMQRACRGETVTGHILDIVRADGTKVNLYSSAAPLLDANGRPCGAVGAFMDITGQRRAEEELHSYKNELEILVEKRTSELLLATELVKAERQRLYDVMETLPVYVVLLTSDYHVTFANRFFRERFGESEGRRCYEYLFNRTEPCEICETYEVLKTNSPLQWCWTGPDGRNYDIYDYPFIDADGNTLILEMGIDVTDRRLAEETVRCANSYNRGLIEASIDPLVTIGHDGRITDVNSATEKVTGASRYELIGHDFSDFFTDPDRARAGYRQVFKDGSVHDYELEIKHSDGHVTPVLYNASLYRNEKGDVVGIFAAARDVTQAKLVEEKLRASETNLRRAQEIAKIGSWYVDLDTEIVQRSDEAARIFGQPLRTKVSLAEALELVHPDDREEVWNRWRLSLDTGDPFVIEHRVIVDDNIRWIREVAKFERNPAGRVVGVIGTSQDITERKQMEEALRLANAYNRGLIESSIDPLVTIGYDGRITDVNSATEKVTGVSRQNLIGRDFSDFFTAPDRAKAGYMKVFREGSVRDYELEIRHVNGHVTPVLYNAIIYRDEKGKVTGVFAAARDITERKLADEALRDSEERYRRLFETETDAILLIDKETMSIIDANLAAMYMYGYTHEEFCSLKVKDISTEPEKSMQGIMENRKMITHRQHLRKDGAAFPVEISGSSFLHRGRNVYVEAVRDISERKQTEEELANRQSIINNMAMEYSMEQDRERQLIAEQLHDQVAPKLFLAKMKIHSLFERLPGEEYDSALEEINSLIDLGVQDIRSLSMQLKPPMLTEIGLEAALRWLCEEFRENYGLLIDFEDDGRSKPLTIEMRASIFQVVRELLLNVVKHAGTKNAYLSVARDDGMIMVKVEDNGIGFDAEESSLTKPRSGGFGSYNSRMKIEFLGGSLRIESSPEQGTKVIIKAPIRMNGN